jgi:hypothetical protein
LRRIAGSIAARHRAPGAIAAEPGILQALRRSDEGARYAICDDTYLLGSLYAKSLFPVRSALTRLCRFRMMPAVITSFRQLSGKKGW